MKNQNKCNIRYLILLLLHSVLPSFLLWLFIGMCFMPVLRPYGATGSRFLGLCVYLMMILFLHRNCKEMENRFLFGRLILTYWTILYSPIPAAIFGLFSGTITFSLGLFNIADLAFYHGLIYVGLFVFVSNVVVFAYKGKQIWPRIYDFR